MSIFPSPNNSLSKEELLLRLEEAEETLRAIRCGEVDALVVSGAMGDQIFTLKDATFPYQILIEEMNEGALSLTLEGMILFCNSRFAEILGFPMETILGESFFRFVKADDQARARQLLKQSMHGNSRCELIFLGSKAEIPVGISLKEIKLDGELRLGVVVSDLTERNQAEKEIRELNASLEQRVVERTQQLELERSRWQGIVESIADEVWTCNEQGKINLLSLGNSAATGFATFKDQSAEDVYQDVEFLYPDGQPRPPEQAPLRRSLSGEIVRGEEIIRHRQTGSIRYRQFSSAPMRDIAGSVTGAVVTVRDITEQKRADEGLYRFEMLSANSKDIVLFMRRDNGRILEANTAAVSAYGYSHDELLSLTIKNLRASETRELTDDQMAQADQKGVLFETVHLRKNGSDFPVEVSSQGATIGGVRTLISIVRDITERKQAEAKQAYLASFPEQNPNPIAEVDFDGQVQYANPAAQQKYPDLRDQGSAHALLADWENAIRPFREGQTEVLIREVVVGDRVCQQTLQHLPQKRLVRIYETDITARRHAEEQLAQSNRKLNEILTSIQDDFYVLDRNWNFVYVNRLFTLKIGREPEDFVGNNIWEMFPKHVGTIFEENFRAAMEKREIRRFEIGGKYTSAWYRMTAFPSVEGITVIGSDITERKRAEEALQENQSRLETVFAAIPNVIIEYDANLKPVRANAAAMKLMGSTSLDHSQEMIIGKLNVKKLDGSAAECGEFPTALALSGEVVADVLYEITTVDGNERIVSVYAAPLYKADKVNGVVSIWHDLTERRRAEDELRASEERFRAVVENAMDAILVTDPAGEGQVLSANPAACRLFGYGMEVFSGLTRQAILDISDPNLTAFMRQRANQKLATTELTYKRRDGTRFSGELSSAYYKDKNGERRAISIIRDITERKRAEEHLSAALQEKEILLKEIHHRVKNNMQVISSLLRLQAATLNDPKVTELFADSQRRVRAMALIHEQLYRSTNLAQINFKDYLHTLTSYLRRSYTQTISNVEIRVTAEDVVIEIDQAVPMGLLISELVSNSLKYAFPPTVNTRHSEVWIIVQRESPDVLTLVVGDNGVGLPDNLDIENSSTMGLQLVRSFITQLQGRLLVQRKPGATFTLTIPVRKA